VPATRMEASEVKLWVKISQIFFITVATNTLMTRADMSYFLFHVNYMLQDPYLKHLKPLREFSFRAIIFFSVNIGKI
jgi:hypothetical protein